MQSFELDILRLQASIDLIVFLRMLKAIKSSTATEALEKVRWRLVVTELNQSVKKHMKAYEDHEEAIEAWLESSEP